MKIAMLGSLGTINRLVIPQLVAAGHEVTVITTHADRRPAITALGAQPAVGTMQDVAFLTTTFTGQDVVYLMLSGSVGEDPYTGAVAQANIWKQAIIASGVKRVVDLSSVGADADEVAGSLYAYHLIEKILGGLTGVDLAFVRPTGFYANLYAHLATIHQDHAIYSTVPAEVDQRYVAPIDIATVIIPLLTHTPAGRTVHYAVSDHFTGKQFVTQLQRILQLPDLRWVQISDERYLENLTNHGVPRRIAESLVQTGRYQQQPQRVYADLVTKRTIYGQLKLTDFLATYALAYRGEGQHQAHTLAD